MSRHICGCYYFLPAVRQRQYLPQVRLEAHTTIFSSASRTVLKQKFINASEDELEEIRYAFPLFDGVSVVDFVCKVGGRTIYGLVREKSEARKTYEEAKERGEKAALLEQLPDAADVFNTSVSNIPSNSSVEVSITYIQELKHDAEVDGVRLTIPTFISPRYGSYPGELREKSDVDDTEGISLTIDVCMAEGIPIKKIVSPSHPIEVSLGSLSTSNSDETPSISKASATLALKTAQLEKDFVFQVVAKDVGIPQAILETHPTLPNRRALMTTLVPKFNLKSQKPEIIFIVDRSGSMARNMSTLVSALKIFLKSIPVGCMFNICSFGSNHSFLWTTSQLYSQDTLAEATKHVSGFSANFGGTETLSAIRASFEARLTDMPTELMLLTDGDIWSQQQTFDYVNEQTKAGNARVFPIGIGGGVSSALIEGIARAGRGFAQMVANNEKLDDKIIRTLKGALTPHIQDYRLEVKYDDNSVESVTESLRVHIKLEDKTSDQKTAKPISLYDTDAVEEHPKANESTDIFDGLPKIDRPKILQIPHEIPPLFPFNRTCVYLLLSPETADTKPKSILLKGTSPQGPLELEIPVEIRKEPDQTIHQLAARKATQELEEGRGWITGAITEGDKSGETVPIIERYPGKNALLKRREAVRLGVEFQVGGQYCSFVAVEANEAEMAKKRQQAIDRCVSGGSDKGTDDWDIIGNDSDGFESWSPSKDGMQNPFSTLPASEHSMASRSGGRVQGLSLSGSVDFKRERAITPMRRARMASRSGAMGAMSTTSTTSTTSTMGMMDPMSVSWRSRKSPIISGGGNLPPPQGHAVVPRLNPLSSCRSRPKAAEPKLSSEGLSFKGKKEKVANASTGSGEMAEEEDIDYSDEDMGFGLFDGGSLPDVSYSSCPVVPFGESRTPSESKDGSDSVTVDKGTLLENIIAEQSFEGSWASISISLRKMMGINSNDYRKAVDTLVTSEDSLHREKTEAALSTAIVVVYLNEKLADEEGTWELIVEKAKWWLEANMDQRMRGAAWATATEIVTQRGTSSCL